MRRSLLLVFACMMQPAYAGSMDQSLLKLAPEERAHQACIIKGLDDITRVHRLPKVDRLKTSIFSPATFDGSVVTAKGGAVRSNGHWFVLKFTCAVTKDQMKATSFVFDLGGEIPENKWGDLGLWK